MLEEVKGKLEYLDKHRCFSPLNFRLQKDLEKISKYSQSFSSVNSSKGPNQHTPIVMANIYDPLALPAALNPMSDNYNQRIKQFGAEGDFTALQHVDWFQYFVDLEEVDE